MHLPIKTLACIFLTPCLLLGEPANDAVEPQLKSEGFIQLISEDSFAGWTVPSERWTIAGGVITGDTNGEKLETPEWIYTKQKFADFIFSVEIRLSGGPKANSGIYYRANPFTFEWRKTGATYEAPSGYEYDVSVEERINGSLGDWYARPSLRVYSDREVMSNVFKKEDWNRMTIRARGDRLEYWVNGTKIMDYIDQDPKRSLEGLIGFQMHDKLVMKVELRNISVLPIDKEK